MRSLGISLGLATRRLQTASPTQAAIDGLLGLGASPWILWAGDGSSTYVTEDTGNATAGVQLSGWKPLGGGDPATQTTQAQQPTLYADGADYQVSFANANLIIPASVRTALSGSAACTVVIAWQTPVGYSSMRVFSFDANDFELLFGGVAGNIEVGGAANYYTTGTAGFTGNRHVWVIRYAGAGAAHADKLRMWKSGVEYSAGTRAGTIPGTIPAITAGRVGARSDGSQSATDQRHYLLGIYPTTALDPAVIATGGALDNHLKTLLGFY